MREAEHFTVCIKFNLNISGAGLSGCENDILHIKLCFSSFSREHFSKATFDSPPISPKTPVSAVKCKTPREKVQKCSNSVLSHFFQKRPKTSPTKETQQDGSVSHCVKQGKVQNAHTNNGNDADLNSVTGQRPVNMKEEPMDVGETSFQGLMSIKQEDTGSTSIGTWDETAHSSSPSKEPVIKGEAFITVF